MIQHTIWQATQADLDCLLPLYRAAAARPDCPWDETYPDAATLQADLAEGRLFRAKAPEGRVVGAYALTLPDPGTYALPFSDGVGRRRPRLSRGGQRRCGVRGRGPGPRRGSGAAGGGRFL